MGRTIAWATFVAGALDILYAVIMTMHHGRDPAAMLRSITEGPFPGSGEWGTPGSALGLLIHFGLMAIMAAVFVLAARQRPALTEKPLTWGILYGLATYVVMNLVVVPLRFGTPFPPKLLSIMSQLFAHIVLVGIPIALITARHLRQAAR